MRPTQTAVPSSEADGNDTQLRELYRVHEPLLVRQLARRTGCLELARDLAQESFLKLLRMAPAALARIERPEAYLRRISTNLLRDWSRSRSVREREARHLAEAAETELDQIAVLESRDTLRRLELAMAALKPRTRQIFLDHRLHGLSYAEIAERTGLSVSGVEKQMSKAIAKIDLMLDRD